MNKLTHLRLKLALTGGLLLGVALMYITGIGCLFRSTTGLPCPGCGMTRAVTAALQLDFATAFEYHAMFWALPILYLWMMWDCRPFKFAALNVALGTLLIAGFAINWIQLLLLEI